MRRFLSILASVTCDPQFANGQLEAQTGPASQGVAFFGGALTDGPGAHPALMFFFRTVSRLVKVYEFALARFKNDKFKNAVYRKYKTQAKRM
jgi:hypothetical protein